MATLKRQRSSLPTDDPIEPPSSKRIKLVITFAPRNVDHVVDHPDNKSAYERKPIKLTVKLTPRNDVDDLLIKKAAAFESLLQEKKLSLVLDLDHTLLHSVLLARLSPQDRDLVLKETDDPEHLRSLFRVKLTDEDFVTKLRPGLQHFLEEASKMFQLHVFTKGTRNYALELLKIIDPENVYFGCKSTSSRVLTREDCIDEKKSLDLVIGKDNGILIIDDKTRVWRDVDRENVLEIPKYNFFEKIGGGGRKLSKGGDESETEGWLRKYLVVLKLIHATFFNSRGEERVSDRDVRVLKNRVSSIFRLARSRLQTSRNTHSSSS